MIDRKKRKKFGQNYLIDPVTIHKIIKSIGLDHQLPYLEIGPGHGAITDGFIGAINNYSAVEIDNENIEFLGRLSNEEVLNIVANARAVVTCTKLYEGQPNFLCEASMLGIPSIFPRSGGIEEFFPKNYKLSFEQFNYIDFKEKLKLVNDENFASKVGNENKNYLENLLNKNVLIEMFEKMVKV